MAEGVVTVRQLKSILTCLICKKELNDARVLKCGHVFCFVCIKEDYERQRLNKGNCPVCNEVYFLKERNTQHLSKADIVNNILDKLKHAAYLCAFCQSGDGSMICLKCKLYLCKDCSKRTISMCGHQTITIDYLDTDPFLRDIIQRSRSKPTCPSHPEENASLFGQNCKLVMCDACFNAEHRHHHNGVSELGVSVTRIRNRNIPMVLEKKTKELEKLLQKSEEPVDTSAVVNRVAPTDKERQLCQSNRDKCSVLHKQLSYLFMYGSDKAILEMFYEHEADVDELLKYDPTKETFYTTDTEEYSKSKYNHTYITYNQHSGGFVYEEVNKQ